MKATIRLVLLTALRDRLFGGLIVLLAVSTALAIFLGGVAISEQLQMAVVVAAGSGRIILVLGLTVFAAIHIQGLFETREVEAILARAISRPRFVLAYWLGFSCIAVVLAGLFGGFIVVMIGASIGTLVWAGTLIAECLIVLGVVMFAGLMLERATATVLFTVGFYALARLMGFFVGIRDTVDQTPINAFIKGLMDVVLLFIPRLDLFAQSSWVLYTPERIDFSFLAIQSSLFVTLILGAAAFDLRRKQF